MAFGFVASSILGLIIGVRFRVFALVPVTLLWATLMISIGAFNHLGAMTVLAITAATTLCIQLGYICGSFAASLSEHPAADSIIQAAGAKPRQYGFPAK